MAHELMHLCLSSHERGAGTPKKIFNIAHDYIINDILSTELGMEIPADGLKLDGARNFSAEKIVTMIESGELKAPEKKRREQPRASNSMAAALAGVHKFPARVKCAFLPWHAVMAAVDGKQEPVTTEKEDA